MGSIVRGSAPTFNTISRRRATKRRTANKRGKGETASTNGDRSTNPTHTATRIAELSTTTRLTAGALIEPLIGTTLPLLVHATTLRVATPSAHVSRLSRRKNIRRRKYAGRFVPRINQSLRSETQPLGAYLRTPASYLEASVASPARKLTARPSWSRKAQSGNRGSETASPAA